MQILLELNFNITSIGFKYWIDAIMMYKFNYYKYDNTIENVYHEIANKNNTTRNQVERNMRTARITATEKIQKLFNYNRRITNKTVLTLLIKYDNILLDKMLKQNINHIPYID